MILPILHSITMADVKQQEVLLADRVAVSMEEGTEQVVERVLKVLRRG